MTHPVYLLRHGQSEWNVQRLTQGQAAHPRLTSLGRSQAVVAADLIAVDLQGSSVGRIITSDLVRAAETAQILAGRLGGSVVCDARLREQHLGWLEGRGYDETFAAAEQMDWSDPTLPIAGGESLMEVYERVGAVLTELGCGTGSPPCRSQVEEVAEEAAERTVTILVSHGDTIRMAIAYLSGTAPHEGEWVAVENGAVARIDGQVTWLGQ